MVVEEQLIKRRKLTVCSPYEVYPPEHGGQLRIFHLYANLSKWFDVEIISYSLKRNIDRYTICPGLREIQVPKTNEQIKQEELLNLQAKMNVVDFALIKSYRFNEEYTNILRESAKSSDAVIVAQPYIFPVVREVLGDYKIPIIYDSQNVEYELKKHIIKESPLADSLLAELCGTEDECCKMSDLIFVCSMQDLNIMSDLYDVEHGKFIIVPNGVDVVGVDKFLTKNKAYKKNDKEEKAELQAVFIGSYHGPNLKAVDYICGLAKRNKDIKFIIAGNVGLYLKDKEISSNITVTGSIDNWTKGKILSNADFALNPMPYGSGTNLKMLEYFAFGLPVITTPIGARGLDIVDKYHAIVAEIGSFSKAIQLLNNMSVAEKHNLITHAKDLVNEKFSWKIISEQLFLKLSDKKMFSLDDVLVQDNTNFLYFSMKEKSDYYKVHIAKLSLYRPIYIWGASRGGISVLRYLSDCGITVKAFVDSSESKSGSKLSELMIYSPNILTEEHSVKPFIIIGSMYAAQITEHLQKLGYTPGKDFLEQDMEVPYLFLD